MTEAVDNKCLNCGAPILGAFCHSCGQSANIHRFTVASFFTHDVIHGVWHVDKGIFFTLKEILLRPGYAARAYVGGKRRSYFNVLTLALLIIAFTLFVSDKFETSSEFVVRTSSGERLDDVVVNNIKLLLFSFLPIFAWCSRLFFKRLKYYYAEHLVAATFFFNGFMLLILFQKLLALVIDYDYLIWYSVHIAIQVVYLAFACYQFVQGKYSVAGAIWRIFIMLFFFTSICLVLLLTIYFALDLQEFAWVYK